MTRYATLTLVHRGERTGRLDFVLFDVDAHYRRLGTHAEDQVPTGHDPARQRITWFFDCPLVDLVPLVARITRDAPPAWSLVLATAQIDTGDDEEPTDE